jgi:hypothetical protein
LEAGQVVECPNWTPREPELLIEAPGKPVCRYYLGGVACSRRDIFLCDTEGKKSRLPEEAPDAGEL